MATQKEIVLDTLKRNQIPDNTANDLLVIEYIDSVRKKQDRLGLGILATQKLKDFFNLTVASWNPKSFNTKGVNEKPSLTEGYSYFWIYKYLTGDIKSNHTTAAKKSENADTVSVWPAKDRASQSYDDNFRDNRNLAKMCEVVEIWPECTINGAQVTFSETHLLSAGDILQVDSVDYTVLSEDTEGKVYTLDGSPTVVATLAMYEYNFQDLELPFNKLRKLNKSIEY